jgi:D-aspartate ligase
MNHRQPENSAPARKVVVLGTGVVALGTIHTHTRAGIEVIHVTTKPDDIAAFSRHSRKTFLAPAPSGNGEELVKFLLELPTYVGPALLVPVNDPHVEAVSRNYDLLSSRYLLANQPWDILGGITDKRRLYIRAHEIGVPAPEVRFPESVAELLLQLEGLVYPCILKPYQTPRFFSVYNQKVLVAQDAQSLIQQFTDARNHDLDVMVSEIIPGPDTNLFIYICHLDRDGDVAAEMCVQKIRQHPPDFGVGSVIKTVPMIEVLREQSLKLLRSYNYRGFSATEFKLDSEMNRYGLIEINTRPVLYQRLFIKTGLNFDDILYKDKVEHKKMRAQSYDPEIYWIHRFSEVMEFRRNQRSKRIKVSEFFNPYRRDKIYAVPCFYDPIPFIVTTKKMIVGLFRRHFIRRTIITCPVPSDPR